MHDDARRHDDAKKKNNKQLSNRYIFRVVTIDTTNKGSRPEIHTHAGEESWLNYRIFTRHVELRDTTNKRSLLDTTNKGCLLTLTMMTFPRDPSEDRTY
jgi:hypothetical protein